MQYGYHNTINYMMTVLSLMSSFIFSAPCNNQNEGTEAKESDECPTELTT